MIDCKGETADSANSQWTNWHSLTNIHILNLTESPISSRFGYWLKKSLNPTETVPDRYKQYSISRYVTVGNEDTLGTGQFAMLTDISHSATISKSTQDNLKKLGAMQPWDGKMSPLRQATVENDILRVIYQPNRWPYITQIWSQTPPDNSSQPLLSQLNEINK